MVFHSLIIEKVKIRRRYPKRYSSLILLVRYINNNSSRIIKYAKIVYNQKIKNIDIGYIKNTVDFRLLEEILKQWNNM